MKALLRVFIAVLPTLACSWQTVAADPLDYVIITHSALDGPALAQLIAYRFPGQPNRYAKFTISDGITADSVKRIVEGKYRESEYAPLHLLLIGTAKRDAPNPDIANAASNNFIPVFVRQDAFGGVTSYDQLYTYLEPGDFVRRSPRISVARIPARTESELQAYVNKVIVYEGTGGDATWKRSALFLCANKDRGPNTPSPQWVDESVTTLIDSLPTNITAVNLRYTDFADDPSRQSAFIANVNSGKGLISALGTGSGNNNLAYFAFRQSFDAAVDLNNAPMFPIVLAQSCNLAQFDMDVAPGLSSLAENLLLAPNKGVIGLIGPTGSTSDLSNTPYLVESYNRLFRRGIRQLGNLALASSVQLKTSRTGHPDTYDMISILGDPGLRIDLGSATSSQATLNGSFELTELMAAQNTVHGSQPGVNNARAGVIKAGYLRGQRSFQVQGTDSPVGDPTSSWVVFEDLGITLGPQARFLTFLVSPIEHPEDMGRFSADCVFSDGTLLSACGTCGPKVDQYGNGILPLQRTTQLGDEKFYAFDLLQAYGRVVDKVLITYDANNAAFSGDFKAIFDDMTLVSDWGAAPDVSFIEMQTNVPRNSTAEASVSASDPDMSTLGDGLSAVWSVTHGYITGTGMTVTYHAPSYNVTGAVLTVTVSDKGGHSEIRTKVFNVVTPPPPPTCPHLFAWDGSDYLDQGAVLTRSRFDFDSGLVRDFFPIMTSVANSAGLLKFSLREDGNDVTDLDKITLFAVSVDSFTQSALGVKRDGRIRKLRSAIAPVQCTDDLGFDQLYKVSAADANIYRAYGPGHLIIRYEGLPTRGAAKINEDAAEEGGGQSLQGPPKDQYKIAVPQFSPEGEPTEPNYLSVSVPDTSGGWIEVQKVAPRSIAGLPELVDLSQYIQPSGGLTVKIAWTWNFAADDLSYFRFTEAGISIRPVALLGARHSTRGNVRSRILLDDALHTTLTPDERIDLEFDATLLNQYDFLVLAFRGRYNPSTGRTDGVHSGDGATASLVLAQNYPNPFNPTTTIEFNLSSAGMVRVVVYNVLGQEVKELANSVFPAGSHQVNWDGTDRQNHEVPSGIYLYRVATSYGEVTRKMTLLR